jgi:mannitol-1-phosphate/altronate dehydrogenase
MKKIFVVLFMSLFLASCYQQERNCNDFKTGEFQFELVIDSIKEVSVFKRTDSLQIETFRGKTDTSSVRWINDCEFVLQKINPKNMKEQKSIHMKILTTTEDGYTFEFGFVGDANKQKGFVTKL